MKTCKYCKEIKEDQDFKSKRGIVCKTCESTRKKKWYEENKIRLMQECKENYINNREVILSKSKKYREENREILCLRNKKYYENNKEIITKKNTEYVNNNLKKTKEYKQQWAKENEERLKIKRKKYYKDNKDELNKKLRERIKNDILFSLTSKIRKNILKVFRERGFEKNNKTAEILGCSFAFFKEYIESKFEPWMTWENRGLYNGALNFGWDIDHIIPLITAKTKEDIIKLNHYTNLQPLCSKINRVIKKGRV